MTYGMKYTKTFIVATVKALEKSGYRPQKIFEEMLSKSSTSKIGLQNPMSKDEALKILNIKSNSTKTEIEESFNRLYEKNNPEKGGSLYLQCKAMGAKDFLINKKN